ncbi:hypothetical protein Plim_1900 [Planctopirus limnophila DSM 3776]|uniref:Uncharacterized protein n=1 Tax=Planctopirus limnophila (strain ATCC 43296 / DSM 3776 / IFAM 1008 / Mu 290) TaxID=521674 RepID=D5SYK2_PLAL2|nr:hypothetical protein [Planctopirus limnophila]ADG67730.1 hypothetical protein Plim_1900 [Planctopirus limnophila DSM 3776]
MMSKQAAGNQGNWISHLIGVIGFVIVPTVITMIAPVSYVMLENREGRPVAQASTCLLFVIPFRSAVIDPLLAVETRVRAARERTAEERRRHNQGRGQIDGEGTLTFVGEGQSSFSISVSPVSIEGAKTQVENFINHKETDSKWLFLPANWKFSVFFGGFWAFLTLLYVVGVTLKLLMGLVWLLGIGRRSAGLEESTSSEVAS